MVEAVAPLDWLVVVSSRGSGLARLKPRLPLLLCIIKDMVDRAERQGSRDGRVLLCVLGGEGERATTTATAIRHSALAMLELRQQQEQQELQERCPLPEVAWSRQSRPWIGSLWYQAEALVWRG